MRLTTLLMAFNLIACAVPRPDTTLYVVNAPGKKMKGYNLVRDYGDDGRILPGAVATTRKAETIEDLNKFTCTDPQGLANLKAYLKILRSEYAQCLKGD